jgi:hypothetical protein
MDAHESKKLRIASQRRATRSARRFAALGVFAAALLFVPAATARPATKFVSKHYGYSILLPGSASNWSSSFAFITWSGGSVEPGSPAIDAFVDNRVNRRYMIAAARLPTGTTLAKWTTYFNSPQEHGCPRHGPLSSSTLSRTPAQIFAFSCSDGWKGFGITALHDGLGYFMVVTSQGSISSSRPGFEAARRSFRFTHK